MSMKPIGAYLPQAQQDTSNIIPFVSKPNCQRCDDQGMLAYKDAGGLVKTRPCPDCKAGEEFRRQMIEKLQGRSEIPERYKGYDHWGVWDLPPEYIDGKLTALLAVRHFIEKPFAPFSKAELHPRYRGNNTQRHSMVITGERGMGKTALACTLTHLLIQQTIPTQFITPRGLGIRLRRTFGKENSDENESNIIHELCNVAVLVIDEFNVKASEYMVTVIEHVIRERYNALNARPVIVTANANKDQLLEIWGGQAISALAEMAHFIPMGGKPLRDEAGEVEEEAF